MVAESTTKRSWSSALSHTEITLSEDPRPKVRPTSSSTIQWPVLRHLGHPRVQAPPEISFSKVLEERRSSRVMQYERLRTVVSAIAFATQSRFNNEVNGIKRYRRPSPSAGALHCIEIILIDWRGSLRAFHCAPDDAAITQLYIQNPEEALRFRDRCQTILPNARGTAILFSANVERVEKSYDHFQSLIWRDAGALLQTLFLTFTAYGAEFCPLGLLGNEMLVALGLEKHLIGAGVALVGRSIPIKL